MSGVLRAGTFLSTFPLVLGFFSNAALFPAEPDAGDAVSQAVVELLAIGPGASQKNTECGGTGFFVNTDGYILTNAHVLAEAERCLGRSPAKIMARPALPGASASRAASCDGVGVDDIHDLAVLKTERPFFSDRQAGEKTFLRLDPREVPDGTGVIVTGHPLFAWDAVTESGKTLRRSSVRLSPSGAEPAEVLVLDIPLRPGNSGSPVYIAGGGVVAIVEGQDRHRPGETFAVPVRYAIELLDRLRVTWHPAGNDIEPDKTRAEKGE